jgi:hypothetical protein
VRGISTPRAPLVGATDSRVDEVLPLLFFIRQSQRNTPQLSLCEICYPSHILVLGWEFKPLWACVSWARASHNLSTCDLRRKAFEAFVTLGGSPPRWLGIAGYLPRVWWAATSLWGLWSCLFVEKIALVERRKAVERDPTCCGRFPLQAPQRRRSRSLVGVNFWKQILDSSLWFASLALISSIFTLLPLDLLRCTCLWVQGSFPCL